MENGFSSRNQQISFTLNIAETMGDVIYFTQLKTPNFKNVQTGNVSDVSTETQKMWPLTLAWHYLIQVKTGSSKEQGVGAGWD